MHDLATIQRLNADAADRANRASIRRGNRHVYRLYTEGGKGLTGAAMAQVDRRFDGYTVLTGSGVWLGIPESAIVIEIILDLSDHDRIRHLCRAINRQNDHAAVLWTHHTCHAEYETGRGMDS